MIEGNQINLRAVEEEDAALFYRWFNDPEVTRFLGANAFPVISMAQERAFIQGLRDDRFIDGRYHDTIVMSILEDEWRNSHQPQHQPDA